MHRLGGVAVIHARREYRAVLAQPSERPDPSGGGAERSQGQPGISDSREEGRDRRFLGRSI